MLITSFSPDRFISRSAALFVDSRIINWVGNTIDPEYLVTVPLFDQVKWKTSTGKWLTIKKQGKSRDLISIKVNGKANESYFVTHDLFKNGGKIEILTKTIDSGIK